MKFISLFAGIGGLDLGLERAGMECVAQVEIDDFCQKILTKHWADVPKFKDVRDVGKHNLPSAELICGGFPCQDVSLAGLRKGLEGERSTLWSEFYRIVCEIQPRWVVIENVRGLLSSDDGQFFTNILWQLSAVGYDVEWRTVRASQFGSPHERARVFIVAYTRGAGLQGCINEQSIRFEPFTSPAKFGNRSIIVGGWWGKNSANLRMGDGFPLRVSRRVARVAGNAVVPQVAEFVGYCVMKAQARLTSRALDGGQSPKI